MELNRLDFKALRCLSLSLLLFAGLVQAQIVIPPGGGEQQPEEMVSERESYKAETLNDFSQVYKVDRHFYKLKSEDVGNRSLVIRVVEKKAGGTELSRDIKTIALTVEEEAACLPPTIEAISSPSELRNVFNSSFQGSGYSLQGKTSLEPDSLMGGSFNYQLPGVKVTLNASGRLSVESGNLDGSDDAGGYNMHVYRDDGNLDQSDLVSSQNINSYPAGIDLDAGNYIVAFSVFSYVRINGSNLQSSCTSEWSFCSGSLDFSMQLAFDQGDMTIVPLQSATPSKGVVPPFQYKATSPGGISRVSMQHNGQSLDLRTEDEVIYFLDLENPEHLNFLGGAISGQTQVDITLRAENNCGMNFEKPYRIDVLPDVAPSISSASSQALSLQIGEIQQRALVVQDPGFNVQHIKAVLLSENADPSSLDLSLSNYSNEIVAEVGSLNLDDYGWTSSRTSELSLRVPVEAKVGLNPGNFQFRFLVFDGLGNSVVSSSVNAEIKASDFPPSLTLTPPGFRIPAGGKTNVEIKVRHQAPLANLEYQIGSADVQTVNLNGDREYDGLVQIDIPQNALIGDSISFSATVTDQGGKASTEFAQIEVGDWGENSITIDASSGIEELTLAHSYSNITVLNTSVRYANPDIQLNRLTIGNGGEVITQYRQLDDGSGSANENLGELTIREQLDVQAGGILSVDSLYTRTIPGFTDFRSSHGGAALEVNAEAFDSISLPVWPGMSGPDQGHQEYNQQGSGGGVLIIHAPAIVVNGTIHANGKDASSSGAGAGGTVRLHTTSLSGTGTVSANGGNCTGYYCNSSGAGGRIAIYFDSFSGGDILDSLTLQAREGTKIHPRKSSGPGTVYVKAQSDAAPSLLISSNTANNTAQNDIPSTVIYGLLPHTISQIEDIGSGQQKITISDNFNTELKWSQTYPSTLARQSLIGQPFILDSSQSDGSIYTVIANTDNSLTIDSSDDLSSYVGKELVGILRLKELRVENKASISTGRLLYADSYDLTNNNSIDDVPRIETGADTVLGHLDTAQKNTFLGNVIADSVTIGDEGLNVRGNLTVNGDFSGNGSVEIIGDLNADNFLYQVQYSSFKFKVGGDTVIGSGLSLDLGTYDFNGDLSVDSIALTGNTTVNVGNNLSVTQGVTQKDSSKLIVEKATQIGADLDLDNSSSTTFGTGNSTITGNALLEDSSFIRDSSDFGIRTISAASFSFLESSGIAVVAAVNTSGNFTSNSSGYIDIKDALSAQTVNIENVGNVTIARDATLSATDVLLTNVNRLYLGTVSAGGRFEINTSSTDNSNWSIGGIDGNPQTQISARRTIEIEGAANVSSLDCSAVTELKLSGAFVSSGGISLDDCKMVSSEAVSAGAQVSLKAATLQADSLTLSGTEGVISQNESELRVKNTANLNGPLVASSGSSFKARNLSATVFQLDGSTQQIVVNVESLQSTAAMTLLDTVIQPFQSSDSSFFGFGYSPISVQISSGGTLLLNENSRIDMTNVRADNYARDDLGLSYPACLANETVYSHAGVAAGLTECFYGHYDRADTAGFGSDTGGSISLEAPTVNIQGNVLAYGANRYGSGGSIKIQADQLLGSGTIDVRGFCDSCGSANSADGGGRALIAVDDVSGFTGSVFAQGAQDSSQIGGAGTILYANRDLSNRKLIADNGGNTAAQYSTPVHTVGELVISNLTGSAGIWDVEVAGTPWTTDNELAGRLVNLDVNDGAAPNYTIHSHTDNTLKIHTDDDLSVYDGKTLIGVHVFEIIEVKNGAYLDFGADRVIVNNIGASTIDLDRIRSGSGSVLQ
ncbi:hypothetical protein [Pseudoteredinibacter isoporae]|uniref:Uncharacterized protein n=1 Tax=Pseudoteredinibacter isoporae TaxID=570281 RepID=A0A7X0JUY2_9GAMM|nr:hypothetical protein [Pseudoteredinibacter isoporae]MBB6521861.1 hypothetical protein [Pseudoteredinibacter isoporae]NHO87405.1 hypothetical protein [Pseudoteredinibacter isoporae]NIB24264.1 hypothetical protein [Pseudoteredinibacter isoporae]